MNNIKIMLIILMGMLIAPVSIGEQRNLPPELSAVREYILKKDYPELFKDKYYRVKAENMIFVDVDNDGRNDVVAHYNPHYRQSAPIVFYRVSRGMKVTQVKEGLAPGPLVPLTGAYLDSHTLAMALDLTVKYKGNRVDPVARHKFIKNISKSSGGVVAYKNFIHTDGRSGTGVYIDMTHINNPPKSKNCESFEFSKVRQVAVGRLKGKNKNYLVAWVGNKLYIYLIRRFSGDGFIDKQRWVRTVPKGFQGLVQGKHVAYRTATGKTKILDIKN